MKMPFSKNHQIKKVCRNSPGIRARKRIIKSKRAALFCSRGTVTLEASLALCAFFAVTVPVISLITYADMQSNIQMNLENVARDIAQKSYYTAGILSMDIVSENLDSLSNRISEGLDLSEEDKGKIKSTSFTALVAAMMTKECGLKSINDSYIIGGIAGISYEGSSYDAESGRIILDANYCVRLPMTGFFDVFESSSKVITQSWSGKDISKKEEKVYITKNGTVYHKSLNCKYLDIGIKSYDISSIGDRRNKSGARYKPCEYCDDEENTGVVYVTDYGRRYHNKKDCSRLLRSIITIDISKVGNMPLCSSCAGDNR